MKPFVRVAEIWVPDADGYLLEFGGGLYEQAPEFGAISRGMCFGRGEGLPGRVWDERKPVILHDLQSGYFQRAAIAKAAGLSCAVAFPIFFADLLKAVVVLFCAEVPEQSGAIEVWCNDPRVTTDLRLQDGVYGAGDAAFEQASREAMMPRGAGLPGLAWQRQGSVFIDGVSESGQFLRGAQASATGIRSGLAVPCPVPGNESYVLAFLSAPSTPIATRIESWVAGADGQSLMLAWSSAASAAASAMSAPGAVAGASVTDADPAIFEAFASGVARVGGPGADTAGAAAHASSTTAASALLALPIASDGVVVETVVLYF